MVRMRSVYYRMMNLITVEDLMTPLGPDVNFGESSIEAFMRIMEECADADYPYDPVMRASLVKQDGEVVGLTYPDVLGVDIPVGEGETMDEIHPSRIISSNTNILRFIETMQFASAINYLVIDANTYVGTMNLSDLLKMPFRLCLLALTLDLEQLITQYAMKAPETSWSYLPIARQKIARNLFLKKSQSRIRKRTDDPPIKLLLDYTSYSDKCRILKDSGLVRKIHYATKVDFQEIIDSSVEFRNLCAHSTQEDRLFELFKLVNIKEFTNKLRSLNHNLLRELLDSE